MINKILIGTLLAAALATIVVSFVVFNEWQSAGGRLSLDQLRFFLDAYKTIAAAFLVALLAVVIPQLLPEAKDKFERYKDSRVAYSRAKTAVIYLPERIAYLAFIDAVSAVQEAHEKLHFAETYPNELRQHLRWHPYPDTWVDRNYWELFALRKVLHENVDSWSQLSPGARLRQIQVALSIVRDLFGHDNKNWATLAKPVREQAIEEALNGSVPPSPGQLGSNMPDAAA